MKRDFKEGWTLVLQRGKRHGKYKNQKSGGRKGHEIHGTWKTACLERIMC